MICYWGEDVRVGFGLIKPEGVKNSISGIRYFYPKSRIRDLSHGKRLIGFVRGEGNVSVMKLHNDGNCGRLKSLELKKTDQIRLISCGESHAVLLSYGGNVLFMNNYNVCRPIKDFCDRKVIQIACGDQHFMALTNDGQLFTWGQNSSGQLGLGKGEPTSLSPQPLKSLCGIPLAQISAGGDHSFALSLSGAVFGWGRNTAGQLGLGDREDRYIPTCVNNLNHKKTVFISCGEEHTAALTKGGTVFTFGLGRYGQLGHNLFRDELRPRVVGAFWGTEVYQITCGRHHTLALVGSSKTVYSFGCGEQGQLGNGQRTNQCVPLPVCLPPEVNQDHTVEKIIAGGNHSFTLCSLQESENSSVNPGPEQRKGIVTLGERMIDRWVSEIDSENTTQWKAIKKEIKTVFSSVACLNGSFIKKSNDGHYETSTTLPGLDMESVRAAFEQIATKERVLLEVQTVVEMYLLPSLPASPAGVEALRIYLILPELLRVLIKQNEIACTRLTVGLASAILKLDQESSNDLVNLWIRLPYSYYRTLVKTFHSVSVIFMSQLTIELSELMSQSTIELSELMSQLTIELSELICVLKVLQKLYAINNQRVTGIANRHFYIREVSVFFDLELEPTVFPWISYMKRKYEIFFKIMKEITAFPCIFDMKRKCKIFCMLQRHWRMLNRIFASPNLLHVNRESALTDTFTWLKTSSRDFYLPLEVKFLQEDGLDYRGVQQEFFTILGKEIKAANVIQEYEDSTLLWFDAEISDPTGELFCIGVICGMAFSNCCFMNVGFPLALFKKLLGLSPTLRDLEELSPVEARSLRHMLMEDEDVVEDLCLDFTVKGTELIPNGAEIPITKINRQKYVDLYVDFVFNKSVEHQFKQFARGFSVGNPWRSWNMFLPEELRVLLCGTSKYEWEELRQCATYENCGPSDELIQNFWTVFLELSEENQVAFLIFVYGTDRLPLGGLSKLNLKIVRCNYIDADDRFPEAQTCFGTLSLPNYSNIDILRDKLVHAINYCEVFGKM